jgi:hypothetical protein
MLFLVKKRLTYAEKSIIVFELLQIAAMIYVISDEDTREFIRCMCSVMGPFITKHFPQIGLQLANSSHLSLLDNAKKRL